MVNSEGLSLAFDSSWHQLGKSCLRQTQYVSMVAGLSWTCVLELSGFSNVTTFFLLVFSLVYPEMSLHCSMKSASHMRVIEKGY